MSALALPRGIVAQYNALPGGPTVATDYRDAPSALAGFAFYLACMRGVPAYRVVADDAPYSARVVCGGKTVERVWLDL